MESKKDLSSKEIAKEIFEVLGVEYKETGGEFGKTTFEAQIRDSHVLWVVTSSKSRQIGIGVQSSVTHVRLSGVVFTTCGEIFYETRNADCSCSPSATGEPHATLKKTIILASPCGEATIVDAGPGKFFGVEATIY